MYGAKVRDFSQILCGAIWIYTADNLTPGTAQQIIESKYTFLTWKDRLSSYNGETITYDVAGNPIKYGNTTYVWSGKQLVEIQPGDGSKTQFAYDADGLRTQKRQYNTEGKLDYYVDYVWQNGRLTQQVMTLMGYNADGSTVKIRPINTKFVYDGNSDQPTTCFVGEMQMLFVRNLQGDIVAVVNSEGEVLVIFTYDAWGNVESTVSEGQEEGLATLIPLFCPLTYRGYNYDFTTGLYYLQSRYYNPEWGRFMNVDDTSILLATQGETHNANLFAYCNNNPVNNVDYTGLFKSIDHYNYTLTYARNLFGDHYGCIIAKGSYDIDTLYPPVAKFYNKYNQSFHFNINESGPDSRDVRAQELCTYAWDCVNDAKRHKQTGDLYAYKASMEQALYTFGKALHPLQDKIAHSGQTGDIKIGIGKANFHMHLFDDDDPSGIYYHPILKTYMTKHDAVQINTIFVLLVIYSGLIQRGIDIKELQREPAHISARR